jgi:chorismate mutase
MYNPSEISAKALPWWGRLVTIKNEGDFTAATDDPSVTAEQQGISRYKFEARCIIDRVDVNICDFIGNFNLRSHPNGNIALSQGTIETLDGTPQELLMAILRYVDFSKLDGAMVEKNTQTLSRFVAERFLAISLVAHNKKLNGESSSFHPERHEMVLRERTRDLCQHGHNHDLARKVFGEFMQAGCVIQDAYINDTAKDHCPVSEKLQRHGIRPMISAHV